MLPLGRVIGHREWAPGRKTDPRYDMNWRRAGVAGITPRNQEDNDMTPEESARLARVERGLLTLVQQMCGPGATLDQPFPGPDGGGGWPTQRYNVEPSRLTLVMFAQEIDRQLNSVLDLTDRPGADGDNAWGHDLSARAEVRDNLAELRAKLDDLLERAPEHPGDDSQLAAAVRALDDLTRRVLALEARR